MNMYRGDGSDGALDRMTDDERDELEDYVRSSAKVTPFPDKQANLVPTPRFNCYTELLGRVGTALMTTLICVVILAVIVLIVLLGLWAIVEVARWL